MALIAKLESDKVKDQDKKSPSKSSLAKKKAAAKKSVSISWKLWRLKQI